MKKIGIFCICVLLKITGCVTTCLLLLCSSSLFPADTKRKVEQISEELKNLDEMLAGNEGADGTVEVTAEETTPPPSNGQGASDGNVLTCIFPPFCCIYYIKLVSLGQVVCMLFIFF